MTLDPPHHIDKAPRSGSLAGSTRQLEMRRGRGVLDNLVASSVKNMHAWTVHMIVITNINSISLKSTRIGILGSSCDRQSRLYRVTQYNCLNPRGVCGSVNK